MRPSDSEVVLRMLRVRVEIIASWLFVSCKSIRFVENLSPTKSQIGVVWSLLALFTSGQSERFMIKITRSGWVRRVATTPNLHPKHLDLKH